MSKAHLPPVPPHNRPRQGDAVPAKGGPGLTQAKAAPEARNIDPTKQGQQGGVAQNTHHQGYQQDR